MFAVHLKLFALRSSHVAVLWYYVITNNKSSAINLLEDFA